MIIKIGYARIWLRHEVLNIPIQCSAEADTQSISVSQVESQSGAIVNWVYR